LEALMSIQDMMVRKSVADIIASGEGDGHGLRKALGAVSVTAISTMSWSG
jgi:hypothetical protein